MAIYAAITPFTIIRKLKSTQKACESFVLTIEDDAIVRQMADTPEIRILTSNIRSIGKTKKRSHSYSWYKNP